MTPMNDFFDMEVRTLNYEADGVISLALYHPLGEELPAWEPGAHLDVLLPNGILRQYSLCSDPASRTHWRLGVLREPDGRGGSAYVHDELRPGTKVQVRPPRNNFPLQDAEEYVFVAGGIGITPILPMVREAIDRGAKWRLLYLGRSRKSMAFLPEVEELRQAAAGSSDGASGEVIIHADDEDGLYPLEGVLDEPQADFHLYTCGPPPLLGAIQRITEQWEDQDRFHFERFIADPATTKAAVEVTAAVVDAAGPEDGEETESDFVVELADGSEIGVPPRCSILEALEDAGLAPLNSCREGICGTCETPVLAGEIDHRDSLLSDEERDAQDTMMICVSRCRGDRLVLDL